MLRGGSNVQPLEAIIFEQFENKIEMNEKGVSSFEAKKYSTIETLLLVVGECIRDMVQIHEDAIELPLAY